MSDWAWLVRVVRTNSRNRRRLPSNAALLPKMSMSSKYKQYCFSLSLSPLEFIKWPGENTFLILQVVKWNRLTEISDFWMYWSWNFLSYPIILLTHWWSWSHLSQAWWHRLLIMVLGKWREELQGLKVIRDEKSQWGIVGGPWNPGGLLLEQDSVYSLCCSSRTLGLCPQHVLAEVVTTPKFLLLIMCPAQLSRSCQTHFAQ